MKTQRADACYACSTTRRWRSVYGAVVCAQCHPPAKEPCRYVIRFCLRSVVGSAYVQCGAIHGAHAVGLPLLEGMG